MKLSTKQLRSALSECGRAIKGRSTLPAIQCVKLSMTDDDRLQLEATNLDAWITRRIDCAEGIEPVMVNHKKLSEVLSFVNTETVELTHSEAKLTVRGVGGGSVVKINTLPGADFAGEPEMPDAQNLAVNTTDLADGLDSVLFAATKDEKERLSTQCIIVDMKPTSLTCAATMRVIMWAVFRRALICEDRKFLLPASQVPIILPDLREEQAMASMTENMFRVTHMRGSATIKLVEAECLPYERVLAGRVGKGTLLETDALRKGCSYAMLFTSPALAPSVMVERKGNEDEVSIWCACDGEGGVEEVMAPGDPLRFKVPADQLAGCLAKTMADEVGIVTNDNAVFFEAGDMLFAIARQIWEEKK